MKFLPQFKRQVQLDENVVEDDPGNGKALYIVGLFFTILVTVISIIMLFLRWNYTSQVISEPTKLITKPEEESPRKTVMEPGEWTIEVLNASGIRGEAKRVGDSMGQKGYVVTRVGNTTTKDKGVQLLYVQEKYLDKKDMLISSLAEILPQIRYEGVLDETTPSARLILTPPGL